MVVIRLARAGKKGAPVYKIMVADKPAKLTGKFIEKLGVYTPGKGPGTANDRLVIDLERFNHWTKLGAQATPRVKNILKTHPAGADGASARNS